MITALLVSLALPAAPAFDPAVLVPPAPALHALQGEGSGDAEFDAKLAAAGKDVDKLWALAEAMREADKRDLAKLALRKLIEVSPDHEEARKALGHRQYDGQWFESYSALSKYRREEDKRMAEKGLVRFGEEWAPEADVPFLRMGWAKDDRGAWAHPAELTRREEIARLRSEGYTQREDGTWLSPDETAKAEEGKWKCGDEWLDLEKANEFHAQMGQWWELQGEHFVTLGTVPRKVDQLGLDWARWWAEQSYRDLVRALGVEPKGKPSFLVLRNLDEYNAFAAGDPARGLPVSEISGYSSVHFAYFADALIDPRVQPPMWRGMGVCYWDLEDPNLTPFGQFAVRHAAAHSYIEAIDPSWETVSQAIQNPAGLAVEAFWGEKRIPRWLRYGIASYCERYAKNPQATEGGDPWDLRSWALQNLRAGGDLAPLEQVFGLALDPADPEGSVRRIHQAGLLVAFALDGDCKPVKDAHEAFKVALESKGDTAAAVQALQEALAANLDQLKAFAKF